MQRVLLALVVAAALAAIGWFGFWEPEPEPAADDAPRVRNFSGGASPIDFNTLEQDPELKEAGPELEAKGAEKAPPAPAPAEQPPAPLVDGTLVLIDSQGGEQPPATGTIELTWTNPPPRTATVRLAHKVPIEDGRLSFALPRGQRVEPGLFHFDGGVAVPIEDEILVPETGAIEIRAKVVRPTVLHVVDD
ncbi:MAG: hypothetical protein P1V36_01535, partial [Planctomycetota bacterium]|nr:hypothetical protein [Planctomycetota bacterium]